MSTLAVILVIVACISGLIGFLALSQATTGVGLLAGACLAAILARMAQASHHQGQLTRLMRAGFGLPDRPAPSGRPGAWICPTCRYENGAGLFDCPHCGTARPTVRP